MNSEIPHKYKYMLNKIINCIIEYIMKNLNNHNLIETKLLLINNYILDVFHNQELSRNKILKKKFKKISISKTFHDKTMTPEYDKKITLSKFNNICLNIMKTDKNSKEPNNERLILPYNDKFKINKLKILLKNEQDKSMIMELAYLKKLSFIQEKLNYYESKRNFDNITYTNNLQSTEDNKNFIFMFTNRENEKAKSKNKLTKNLNNFITIKNPKNKKLKNKINDIFPPDTKNIKHSISLSQFNDDVSTKRKHSLRIEKLNGIIKNKNKLFKLMFNGNK